MLHFLRELFIPILVVRGFQIVYFLRHSLNPLFTDLFSLFITPENILKTDFLMFLMVKKEVLSAYKFMCIIMQMQETNFPVLIVSSLMFL